MVKRLVVIFITVFLTACVSTKKEMPPLPKDEQVDLYLQMGARYLEMGMLEVAKGNLEKAEEVDPDNANVHNALGALHERMKQFPEAKKEYQKAVELDANNFGAINNYGRFLCERGEIDEGLSLLNDALSLPLNNRKWFAYTNLGRCELNNGNSEQAENHFRAALQINRKFSPALFEMQKISYHSENYMSARAFLERYLAVSQHTAQSLWYAVQTERALNNQQSADAYQGKLFNLFPTSKEARQLKIQ